MDFVIKKVRKPTRILSGVTVVAIMTKPFPCPHGRCIYCPGGVSWGTPQSYVRESPAVMRARRLNYDPYLQVHYRLKQYEAMGHKPSKVELIVMGGTFPATPLEYQRWVIAQALEAMNNYPEEKRAKVSLEEAKWKNERARIRCIGLTIETRPDWALEKHIDNFLDLGATRIELGVQSIYEDVLKTVKRGHGVDVVVKATQLLKDAGYKVLYHLMPGLPGSDVDRDLEMFKRIFEDPAFRPDMLKIYPTIVVPGTELYRMWKRGEYRAYTSEELIELLLKVLEMTPPYVRIMRIQRDIPMKYIVAGLDIGNLREVLYRKAMNRGIRIREIRYREIGRFILRHGIPPKMNLKMNKYYYEASNGTEVFLSIEDPQLDVLIAFLRLRIPSEYAHRWEVNRRTAIIRELHVYGPQVPIGEYSLWWQHRGYGRRLLIEAERIAIEEFDCNRMLVISGVGVREYYRKFDYEVLPGSFYMYKNL